MTDTFDRMAAGALTDLTELYGAPLAAVKDKVSSGIGPETAAFLAACPLAFLSSHDVDGRCDVTPRGGNPGFLKVLDSELLVIGDVPGNRRLDTMHNIVGTGRLGLLALIPGRDDALRLNGRARVTTDPGVLALLEPQRKPAVVAIVMAADEVFVHCARALTLSQVWSPDTWPDATVAPSLGELWKSHLRDNGVVS